jgi:methionyl-tRNA formyltransferase
MLAETMVDILDTDSAATLHDKLASAGARLLVDTLPDLLAGRITPTPQPEAGACYASKISKAEAHLDFSLPAAELSRSIRAFDPFPGAVMIVDGTPVKLWRASVLPDSGVPGRISRVDEHGIVIGCGEGSLCVTELQKSGGRRLPVAEFLRGHMLISGQQAQLPV